MKMGFIFIFTIILCTCIFAQTDLQKMFDAEKAFDQAAINRGQKSAFLEFFADDSVIFRPNAINGREFWKSREDPSSLMLVRNPTYADIAANGLLGYTTGNWELQPKGKTDLVAMFGQYVTIWEKKQDGKFHASLDIGINHDKPAVSESIETLPTDGKRDLNKRGWSAADASMNFLRMSMTKPALSGAYAKFAAEDVRFLRERRLPISGKKSVVTETKHYVSVDFPKKITLYESADMAYIWNACQYSNSNEGTEKGNCLHIWKLRNEKWWIVLGVFAPVANETQPTLKIKNKSKKSQ